MSAAAKQMSAAKRSRGSFVSASSALRQTPSPPALPSRRRRAPWRYRSGAVCRFFLQGRCRFGDRCRNEHPAGGSAGPSAPKYRGASRGEGRCEGGRRGGRDTGNQRHFSRKIPSGLRSSNNTAAVSKDEEKSLGAASLGAAGSVSAYRFSETVAPAAAAEPVPPAKRARGSYDCTSSALRQTPSPPALRSRRPRAPGRHRSGAVCPFFLQGHCRFGDRCRNKHPAGGRGGLSAPKYRGASTGGGRCEGGRSGGLDTANQRHFSQNRSSGQRSSDNTAAGSKDEEERLLKSVVRDMQVWESSGQWLFSSYAPLKEKPNVPGFLDVSPEELRLEYYTRVAAGDTQTYLHGVQWLATEWRNRQLELKALNASTKAALLSALKNTVTQPSPAFGVGGQQTSSFELPSAGFPGNTAGNSASGFSFQLNSNLVSASSGNTTAFGSSAAASNTPAIGVAVSPSAFHPVGFGSLAAPSAASSSFKTPAAGSGFGTSGFGSSSTLPLSSSIDPLAGFHAAAALPSQSSSTSSAQPASASGQNRMSAPSTDANGAVSEKLYTPMSELSAEELEQFKAARFTLGKIPLKPPPIELIKLDVGLQ